MATESDFYLRQAEQCAVEAAAASLPNRRDMLLRAKAVWQALADRRLLTEANREKLEASKHCAPKN